MFELEEEEEVLGTPSFEVLMRDGLPVASGSYFMAPPLYMSRIRWDDDHPGRLLVTADDGSEWHADDVPTTGTINVVLRQVS